MAVINTHGIGKVYVEGLEQIAIKGGIEITPQTETREGVANQDGSASIKITPRLAEIKFTAAAITGIKVTDISKLKDISVSAECADGRTFTMTDAFFMGDLAYNNDEGTYDVTFQAANISEDF